MLLKLICEAYLKSLKKKRFLIFINESDEWKLARGVIASFLCARTNAARKIRSVLRRSRERIQILPFTFRRPRFSLIQHNAAIPIARRTNHRLCEVRLRNHKNYMHLTPIPPSQCSIFLLFLRRRLLGEPEQQLRYTFLTLGSERLKRFADIATTADPIYLSIYADMTPPPALSYLIYILCAELQKKLLLNSKKNDTLNRVAKRDSENHAENEILCLKRTTAQRRGQPRVKNDPANFDKSLNH